MNEKPRREEKGAKFFATLNYVELGEAALLEDFHKLQDNADVMTGPEGKLEVMSAWEERGLDTGNPHMHMIIVFKTAYRTRCPAVANLLIDVLGLQVRPHIEPLKDLRGAVQYRDKPSKAEAWDKWTDRSRTPAFFVLIHAGSLKERAPRELEQILGEPFKAAVITKRLFLNIPI